MKKNLLCKLSVRVSFCVFLVAPFALTAQVISKKIAQTFPPSVVYKMYTDVAASVALSEDTQLWLARAYSQRDSLLAILVSEGKTPVNSIKRIADSTGWAIELGLKEVMQADELREYMTKIELQRPFPAPVYKKHIVPDAEMGSQFGAAIKVADKLKLRDTQADSILLAAATLREKIVFYKANPDSGYFDKIAYESAYLSKTLNESQYNILLAEKNKDAAAFQARQDWYDLKAYGLAGKFQKDSTIKIMTIYNLIKAHVTERFAHQKSTRTTMLKALRMPEPVKVLYQAKVGKTAELNKYEW